MKTIKTLILCSLLLGTVAVFAGCRTAHGFGEDMENAGQNIQNNTP